MDNVSINFQANIDKNTNSRINLYLKKHLKQNILLLLSAGSSFSLLPFIDIALLGNNFTIGVLDERFDQRKNVNNFLQLMKTDFYKNALQKNCSFIDTSIKSTDTLINKAKEWEMSLQNWKNNNPKGKVVITQGIGSDGHTAGIFPFEKNDNELKKFLTNEKQWIIGYDVKNKNSFRLRITPTLYFLKNFVDKSFVYIVGEDKKEIFHKVLNSKDNVSEVPARIIHTMKSVEIYTNIFV